MREHGMRADPHPVRRAMSCRTAGWVGREGSQATHVARVRAHGREEGHVLRVELAVERHGGENEQEEDGEQWVEATDGVAERGE